MSSSPHHYRHLKEKILRRLPAEEIPLKDIKEPSHQSLNENITTHKVAKQNRGKFGSHRTSKRTSPDTVDVDTMPQHMHKEGLKWIKAIRKQIANQTRRLSKKLMRHVRRYRGK